MRIIVENSGYSFNNLGDVAMLQVAAERLRNLFPRAELCIPTMNVERLAHYIGGTPLNMCSGRPWGDLRLLPIRYAWLPEFCRAGLGHMEHAVRRRAPIAATRLGLFWHRLFGQLTTTTLEGVRTITEADLVVATGGGYLTDEAAYHTLQVLQTIGLAQAMGRPTTLLGQGIGPVRNPTLLARMREVLPQAGLITLREGKAGIPLLRSLGVSEDKIVVTGDDAIEPAYLARPVHHGNDIGINLRLAKYSLVDRDDACTVASVLHAAARHYRTLLRPIPIDWRHEPDSDLGSLRLLLNEQANDAPWPDDNTTNAIIRQVGRCRIVVTGSYHAGVFALSQGIPVVGIVRSRYYIDKFLGLADQFGCGCTVLTLDASDFEQQLAIAIDQAWQAADDWRPVLIEAAERQIAVAHDAYRRLISIVASAKPLRRKFKKTHSGRSKNPSTSPT